MSNEQTEQSTTVTTTEYGWSLPNGTIHWGEIGIGSPGNRRTYKAQRVAEGSGRHYLEDVKRSLTEQAEAALVPVDDYLDAWGIVSRTIITITQAHEHHATIGDL